MTSQFLRPLIGCFRAKRPSKAHLIIKISGETIFFFKFLKKKYREVIQMIYGTQLFAVILCFWQREMLSKRSKHLSQSCSTYISAANPWTPKPPYHPPLTCLLFITGLPLCGPHLNSKQQQPGRRKEPPPSGHCANRDRWPVFDPRGAASLTGLK